VERNISRWCAHLLALKRAHPVILHIGVYRINGGCFGVTPGFPLTKSQRTVLGIAVATGNFVRDPRGEPSVIVGRATYVIERKWQEKLSARTEDSRTWLSAGSRGGYLVVGLAEAEGREQCDEVIEELLSALTTSQA